MRTWDETAGLTLSSGSDAYTFESSSSISGSTSWDANGTTISEFSSSSFSSSSSSTIAYINAEVDSSGNFTDSGSASSSASASGSFSSVTPPDVVYLQTSTTESFESYAATTFGTYEEYALAWTTSKEDPTATTVGFYLQETSSVGYIAEGGTVAATTEGVTELTDTALRGLAATVVQAGSNEVLYFIETPPTAWVGYSAATDIAQSGTRFTIEPKFSTASLNAVNGAATATHSTVNQSLTTSVSWSAATSTQKQHTLVNFNLLPNQTSSATRAAATTTTSSLSALVFASGSVEWAASSGVTTTMATTYATAPTVKTRQIGSVVFQSILPTTVSSQYTTTIAVPVSKETSFSASNETIFATNNSMETQQLRNFSTSKSGLTSNAAQNQTMPCPAQVGTSFGEQVSQSRFATFGAIIGASTGAFFTATRGTLISNDITARHGSGRAGVTLMPQTNFLATINSDSITFSTTTQRVADTVNSETSQYTTLSIVASVAGSSHTIQETFPYSWPSDMSAASGIIGKGCTVVSIAGQGAYKDKLDGATTSFGGDATVFTEAQSRQARAWFPIRCLAPLANTQNMQGITFSESRNLANNLPPNA